MNSTKTLLGIVASMLFLGVMIFGISLMAGRNIFTPKFNVQSSDQVAGLNASESEDVTKNNGLLVVEFVSFSTSTEKESITITSPRYNRDPLLLSGLTIQDGSDSQVVIPEGHILPLVGQPTQEEPILLLPGERAVILTGRSPIGKSFKLNKCSGYLEHTQKFSPAIETRCPTAQDEPGFGKLSKACQANLRELPRCAIGNPPSENTQKECRTFAHKNLHYNGCVENHHEDRNFIVPEWRIYLGSDHSLWNRERTIEFYTSDGERLGHF